MSEAANLHLAWSRLLFGTLARLGVTDVVVSSGSRSTPLVLAAHETPGLSLHDVLDERAAAFFALGQARATGRPSVLVCTSGTALAHYHPAVIEASHARLPLLVLSANRPYELRAREASQTIDQTKIFGDAVRLFLDLGMPDADPRALRGLVHGLARAVHATRAPEPGPVQLDAPFRKPLEAVARTAADDVVDAAVRGLLEKGPPQIVAAERRATDAVVARVAKELSSTRRGLLVAGPRVGPPDEDDAAVAGDERSRAVHALARALGFPLLADAASGLRFDGTDDPLRVDGYEAILRAHDLAPPPDLVLEIGAPLLTSAYPAWRARHPSIRRIVLAPFGVPDAEGDATFVVEGDLATTVRALAKAVGEAPKSPDSFAAEWVEAGGVARRVAARLATEGNGEGDGDAALTEPGCARALVRALPAGATLVLGNSLPVRMVDAFCGAGATRLRVGAQRGAAGIDGLLAGAAGTASKSKAPVAILLGDQSFLHDVGGLAAARGIDVPLVVLVVHNDGGRIFEQLPVAARPEAAEALRRHLVMPHGQGLEPAARLYAHAFVRATTPAALGDALAQALEHPGVTVVEARVPPGGARTLFTRFTTETEMSLGGTP